MPDDFIFISEAQVRSVLSFQELIPAMRLALSEFSAGRVIQPVRTVLSVASHQGWFAVMPAVFDEVIGREAGHVLSKECQSRQAYASGYHPAV